MSTNTKRKGFGLVSKIGSLIKKNSASLDNLETSGRSTDKDDQSKKFHIQLSEGDGQDLVDINNMNDEEEEEEEEEEENDKKAKNIKKPETLITKIKEPEKKENKDIIKNEIENDNIENNNIINQEKNNESNSDINTNKNDIINTNEVKEIVEIPEIPDENLVCHTLLKKGNDFFVEDYRTFPIIRNKKKKTVFTKMGLFKKQQKTENVNYILFFNDHLIYFSRDTICDKKEISKRRICNFVSLYNIIKVTNVRDNNNKNLFIINFDIQKNNGIKKSKIFSIDEKYFKDFIETLNNKFKIYNIFLNNN